MTWPSLKVHSASNANQKEKYEADLKKEIKKLQVGLCVLRVMMAILLYTWLIAVKRPNQDMADFQ